MRFSRVNKQTFIGLVVYILVPVDIRVSMIDYLKKDINEFPEVIHFMTFSWKNAFF